jgi:hypothetical protein
LANTISEMMEAYAADAVRQAPAFGARLDYSEASLKTLEQILSRIRDEFPSRPSNISSDDPAQKKIDAASRVWGGYFGETIRRLWGGEWGVETYPGTTAPVVSVDVGGAKIFPVMKVYRRFTQGDGENVWNFYQMVREKVSGQPSQ